MKSSILNYVEAGDRDDLYPWSWPISIISNNFKSLNDICGHQRGDHCLMQVVRALQKSTHRSADLVARYGGEEFAIILPETDRDGALQIAESMRSAVASLAIPHPGSSINRVVTISAGVTTVRSSEESSSVRCIKDADSALYEAKRCGRNRVLHSDPSGDSEDIVGAAGSATSRYET
jgi:diguanylate cyclase (GGDEF)-like protein